MKLLIERTMKKQYLKIAYVVLALTSVIALFVFDYLKGTGSGVSFQQIAEYDSYIWSFLLIPFVCLLPLLLKDKATKIFPILGIVVHISYVILLAFTTLIRVSVSFAFGFYVVIMCYVGMIIISFLYKKAD